MTSILEVRKLLLIGIVVASATASADAAADVTGRTLRIPPKAVADLRRDVARARGADLRPFLSVSDIVTSAHEVDARARGRKAPVALYLAHLGPSALMPMLEMLALESLRGVPAEATRAVRRDLIEAVGLLRDPRSMSVLAAILEDEREDDETTRTVAEAIGRLGTDEAATRIVDALDVARGARERAILAGMGECRRLRVTAAIAARLRASTDDDTARLAARSLGRAGNAWAWRTLPDRSEEALVRETAARALVEAFVRHGGEARTAADNALMVVDDPRTPALITEARRGASAETAAALDALAARFASNPSR